MMEKIKFKAREVITEVRNWLTLFSFLQNENRMVCFLKIKFEGHPVLPQQTSSPPRNNEDKMMRNVLKGGLILYQISGFI